MQIDYSRSGFPMPVYEVGDFVRLRRDEIGEVVTARAGEWGEVLRVTRGVLDIRLAGYSRPRTASMPLARDIASHWVDPCDRSGRVIELQRDLNRQARR